MKKVEQNPRRGNALRSLTLLAKLLALCATLFSCDNFLEAGSFKTQLEQDINFASAQSCSITFFSDSDKGSFLSANEVCKVGYTVTAQFNAKLDSYLFAGLEAVSRTNQNESRADSVQFTENTSESNSEKGTYSYTLKLLKPSDDILVRPVCFSYSPSYASGANYANTPVEINFGTPMESSSTTEENSFFNYTNISITVQGIDRSDLFETPYFNAEKTILTLEPKRDSLISFISETMHTPFIDFIITFPETLPSKNSAQASTLKNPSFTVRYKAESETTPPARYAFFATRHEISLETADTLDTDKMFTEDKEFVSHGNTSDYKDYTDSVLQNRTRGTVYLYGRYYDSESGIKSITVTEKRIYTDSANFDTDEKEYTTTYTERFYPAYISSKDGDTKFCIPYEIISEDGAILLTVCVTDAAGNSASEEFYAVKKSSMAVSLSSLQNDYFVNLPSSGSGTDFDYEAYKENVKKLLYVKDDGGDGWQNNYFSESWYGYNSVNPESYTLACEYIHSDGQKRTDSFSDFEIFKRNDTSISAWTITLDVDTVKDLSLKFSITDEIGNTAYIDFAFPSRMGIESIDLSNGKTKIAFFTPPDSGYRDYNYYGYLVYEDSDEKTKITSLPSSKIATLEPGITYRLICKGNSLWGDLGTETYTTEKTMETLQSVNIKNVSLSQEKTEKTDVTFTIDESSWDTFETIVINDTYIFTKKDGYNLTLTEYTYKMFESDRTYTVLGLTGELKSKTIYTIPKFTDAEYDNSLPYFNFNTLDEADYGFCTFRFGDRGTGVEKAYISVNGKLKYTITEADGEAENGHTIKIPEWELYEKDSNLLTCEIHDKAGNIAVKTDILDKPDISGAQLTKAVNTSGNRYTISSEEYYSETAWSCHAYIYEFDSVSGQWSYLNKYTNEITERKSSDFTSDDYNIWTCRFENIELPQTSPFVKVIAWLNGKSAPTYLYTGSTLNTGTYDLILPNGASKSSVAILSDAPVFVHTMVTPETYENCKNWPVSEWEYKKQTLGRKIIGFSPDSVTPQKYSIPVEDIKSGYCYVVIAHFADGNFAMSEVMQKP